MPTKGRRYSWRELLVELIREKLLELDADELSVSDEGSMNQAVETTPIIEIKDTAVYDSLSGDNESVFLDEEMHEGKIAPKPRPAPKSKRNPEAIVLYDYDAQDKDEISLQEDQIIEVKLLLMLRAQWPISIACYSEFLSQKCLKS